MASLLPRFRSALLRPLSLRTFSVVSERAEKSATEDRKSERDTHSDKNVSQALMNLMQGNNNVDRPPVLKVINVNRTAKVTKGGKMIRFAVTVVGGNRNGGLGIGYGKDKEASRAVQKAVADSAKNMTYVDRHLGITVPTTIIGK
jgi:small subunit ribosomal protein S5